MVPLLITACPPAGLTAPAAAISAALRMENRNRDMDSPPGKSGTAPTIYRDFLSLLRIPSRWCRTAADRIRQRTGDDERTRRMKREDSSEAWMAPRPSDA